ncbi:MAG: hypothetical protein FWD73_11200 [Polyangiaceae bacterium]|nr:hypothetical protein [Polyangiaceae bacterium]
MRKKKTKLDRLASPVVVVTPANAGDPDLVRRTIRTVLLLVGLCVVFVGTLSAVAVFVTSHFTPHAESKSLAPTSHDKKPI